MSSDTGYEAGDVNVVDDDGPDDDFGDEVAYEAGDVNTVAGSPGGGGPGGGDEGFDEPDDDGGTGNRTAGGMPVAVLTYLARSLANEPDAVVVRTEERRGTVVLRLHVAPEDMGRVIGRRGRTAQAIRTLVAVAGARDEVQTSVDIVDA